jgi:hypothetical protein
MGERQTNQGIGDKGGRKFRPCQNLPYDRGTPIRMAGADCRRLGSA